MNMNLVRLRKAAAEGADTGSPEARDNLISAFLEELSGVVSDSVVDLISDSGLKTLYVKWVGAVNALATEEQRSKWLASGVMVVPQMYHLYTPTEEPEDNVVTFTRR